jgi:hypothetical protein
MSAVTVSIGQYLPTETGNMVGPTVQGTQKDQNSLINQDPNASWNTATNAVQNSCAPGPCGAFSPRIVPIAMIDMDEYQWRSTATDWTTSWIPGAGTSPGQPGTPNSFNCPTGGACVRIVNILGFFVEQMVGNDVLGRLVMYPGELTTSPTTLDPGASFLKIVQLIR